MSHFVVYILQFQEIIVYKIPPGGRGSIASLRSMTIRNTQLPINIYKIYVTYVILIRLRK